MSAAPDQLLNQILYPALANHFNQAERLVGAHENIEGLEHLDTMIAIDQQPIGRTPASSDIHQVVR